MALKKGDFITVNYTGKLSDGTIFDTTITQVAKDEGLGDKELAPITVCLGEKHLLPGLDEGLIGKDKGKHTFEIPPEKGFGKKNSKLLELIPLNQFKKQKIMPQRGMEMNIDGRYGVIKNVSGGRVIVDFNHPLAGQDLVYEVEVLETVTDLKKQAEAILERAGIPAEGVEVKDKELTLKTTHEFPPPIQEAITKKLQELTGATKVTYKASKKGPAKEEEEHVHGPDCDHD